MGKKKSPASKAGALVVPKTVFDKKDFKSQMLEEAAEAVMKDLSSCILHIEENRVGRLVFKDGSQKLIRFGEKLGEGSFGSVFALGDNLNNIVVKTVRFTTEYNTKRITYKEWLVKVASEAILLKVFSESGTGPRVPPHSVAFSYDLKTAFFFMERANGSLFDLITELDDRGMLHKWQTLIESQVRKRMMEAIKVGMVCTDLKPENCLYNVRDGKYRIVLSDFDSTFCCSEAESLARDKLSKMHVILPTEDGKGMHIDMDALPPVLEEVGESCPKKTAINDKLILTISLAMMGGAMGMYDHEFSKAVKFIENPKNSDHPVHRAFVLRWVHYNSFFLPSYKRPYNYP